MPGTTMSEEEVRLAKKWAIQDDVAPSEIAERLGRDKSTITRLLKPRSRRQQRGRKASRSGKVWGDRICDSRDCSPVTWGASWLGKVGRTGSLGKTEFAILEIVETSHWAQVG